MKKQILIFLIGFLSIATFLFGIICIVCAFVANNALTIISGIATALVWIPLGILYFKQDSPTKIYDKLFNKK